jgi:hypothetical protein
MHCNYSCNFFSNTLLLTNLHILIFKLDYKIRFGLSLKYSCSIQAITNLEDSQVMGPLYGCVDKFEG